MEIELINTINKNEITLIKYILLTEKINFKLLSTPYKNFVIGLQYYFDNSYIKSKNLIKYYSKYDFSYNFLGILYLIFKKYNKSLYYLNKNKIRYEDLLFSLKISNKKLNL